MNVIRNRYPGEVKVNGCLVAPEFRASLSEERVVHPLRDRTPDEWWQRAAEIVAVEDDWGTAGPLGPGVDFFTDNADVPLEVRQQIEEDAYEAAREAIVAGLAEYARRTMPVWDAVARLT